MATKKKGLGLGLEALLGPARSAEDDTAAQKALRQMPISQLRAGQYQPRKVMDEGGLYELAESIRTQGVMQPLLVRPVGASGYEIIAGERRFRASQLAGLDEVPVLVREVSDEQAAVMALVENMQREDLNPLEEAQGLQRLVQEFKLTHEQAAQAVGRSRSAATNLLRLLQLTSQVQQMLLAGDLDMGHARALLPLDGARQILVAQEVVAKKLSVRDAERLAARALKPETAATSAGGKQATAQGRNRDIARIEEALSDHLAAPVEIRVQRRTKRGEAGEVSIAFGSLEELNGLLQRLGLSET
jgi:ParB family chromosome partitioning protein